MNFGIVFFHLLAFSVEMRFQTKKNPDLMFAIWEQL